MGSCRYGANGTREHRMRKAGISQIHQATSLETSMNPQNSLLWPRRSRAVVAAAVEENKMADRWTVFHAAVRHSLDGWPALHIAQKQGFGGNNFREKVEWLLDVIVQIFKDNGHVYPDELEEYLSECLFNEFDVIVEDGTCPKVVEKICYFSQLCETGQFSKVLDELRVPPPACPNVAEAASQNVSDDDFQGDEQSESNTEASNSLKEQQGAQKDDETMDVDESTRMDDGEDGGWEVVSRSKHKTRHSKSR